MHWILDINEGSTLCRVIGCLGGIFWAASIFGKLPILVLMPGKKCEDILFWLIGLCIVELSFSIGHAAFPLIINTPKHSLLVLVDEGFHFYLHT